MSSCVVFVLRDLCPRPRSIPYEIPDLPGSPWPQVMNLKPKILVFPVSN